MGRDLWAELQSLGLLGRHLSSTDYGLGAVLGTGGVQKRRGHHLALKAFLI